MVRALLPAFVLLAGAPALALQTTAYINPAAADPADDLRTYRPCAAVSGDEISSCGAHGALRARVVALQSYARCLADDRRRAFESLLKRDWLEEGYKAELDAITHAAPACRHAAFDGVNYIVLAGFVANARLNASRSSPPADRPPAIPNSADATENMALCIARIDADGTGRLLRSEPQTAGESAALGEIVPRMTHCLPQNVQLALDREALRAVLALAAYRMRFGS